MSQHPRLDALEVVYLDTIRPPLEHGKLYVSKKYQTALHLCACGCGELTVTPFNTAEHPSSGWTYTDDITLYPSIGNRQFLCRSHYYVTEGRIVWLPPFP